MIDERSSSSILGKQFLILRRGSNPQFSDDRSSEGCRLDHPLGIRNRFLRIELDERLSII